MRPHAQRLTALRAELVRQNLTGFVIPLTDEHMSEYVGDYAKRLEWLTGFGGSAGAAAVLQETAAIFTDGRYTLQVRDQVDGALFSYQSVPETSIADWLKATGRASDRIGYDPWLHTRGWVTQTRSKLEAIGAELVAVSANPVDAIWSDRPEPSLEPIRPHEAVYAGQTSAQKRTAIAQTLAGLKADAVVLSALDSIAWAFNIRGRDVANTPVALAFAIVRSDGSAQLFTDLRKTGPDLISHLGADVALADRSALPAALDALGAAGARVLLDPDSAVVALFERCQAAGAAIVDGRDPCVLPKARKNPAEAAGARAAHRRDGAALSRFLHWLGEAAPRGEVDELTAVKRLREFRAESNLFQDTSFDTIAGAGPNGAIVHYRSSPDTNRPLKTGELFLLDSGGQYLDGTTDVTRTMAILAPGGSADPETRDRFTRVLKGHIAIATARFPKGTSGRQLDSLARMPLWQAGLDYDHGTGHGVGSYLAVHEGPQRIAKAGTDEPLTPGMIVSNEPGYYKTGAYGIRIENLVLVEEAKVSGAERELYEFETLTLAPIDRNLIEPALLTADERAWLNAYHARVLAEVGPQLDDAARSWLAEATAPV
jgi:Xaa-Pro aminopeptidase